MGVAVSLKRSQFPPSKPPRNHYKTPPQIVRNVQCRVKMGGMKYAYTSTADLRNNSRRFERPRRSHIYEDVPVILSSRTVSRRDR